MTAASHTHEGYPVSHTLEGPLKVVMMCRKCIKTEVIKANPRLRKTPWGFTEETWAKFLEAGKARDGRAG